MPQQSFFQDDEILGKAYDARLARRLWDFIQPHRKLVAGVAALVLLAAAVDLLPPFLTQQAIDQFIVPLHPSAHLTLADRANGVFGYALLYLLVLCLGFGLRYVQNLLVNILGQYVMYEMRSRMFAHLQRLSLSFFDHNPVGRLMTRITNDVDAINQMFTSGVASLLGDLLTLVGIVVVLLRYNWQLALVTFTIVPPLLVVTMIFQRAMRTTYRAIRVRLARLNATIAENIAGTQVVQLFNREDRNFAAFDVENQDYRRTALRSLLYFALFFPTVNIFSSVATALIIWVGGGRVPGALSVGVLVAFLSYMAQFFLPIRDLADNYTTLQAAMASAERIFRVLDEPVLIADPEAPVRFERVRGEVEFRDVWFAYNQDEWVLKGVSFHIEPGESVAFVGATGAGKTSLISLISRFYDVQRGAVLVDGRDVKEVSQANLRRRIGAVLQDPFIFAGTIASNIRLHEESISDEQVRAAARFVNADKFIERLPHGYDEEVQERGAGLSVGQKQLLAFARAIAFNPEVLLILDEATSSVDTETEALIQEALERLMRGRTSIIIAHRLSTIRNVDRIIVLHKGRVVEEGTHDTLLARNGYYKRLYELQYVESTERAGTV